MANAKPTREPEILAAYWTLAGDIYVGSGGNQVTDFSFEDRVAASARAGYKGMGFWHDDLDAVSARLGLKQMKKILDGAGMKYVEIEFLNDWSATGEKKAASDRLKAKMLQAAEELHAHHIKIGGNMDDAKTSPAAMVDAFGALCADAARAGTAIGIELMPWTDLATIAQGLEVCRGANPNNGGLLLDIFHLVRARVPFTEIDKIEKKFLTHVEVMDGTTAIINSNWNDAVHHRKLAGEGDFDIPDFLRRCVKVGYDGPWGVEMMSNAQMKRSLKHAAELTWMTTREQFDLL